MPKDDFISPYQDQPPLSRPLQAYDSLKKVGRVLSQPVQQSSQPNNTSFAQVESFVSQQAVKQNSCGLKPDRRRDFRIVIRFTHAEREKIVEHAYDTRLTVSQYVRLVLLNDPGLDPQRNRLLMRINYQLTRHGNNLNQIAKQLNTGGRGYTQAVDAIEALWKMLSPIYRVVGNALTNGRRYEDEA
jgi:hypothetical protein